mmetsp:Transcript_2780/g.4316  ORF Transcript_2780/g.4316 Transcript_2780/m.4316 type:complete len:263 (+) Transcript_2780:3775-4563(+)
MLKRTPTAAFITLKLFSFQSLVTDLTNLNIASEFSETCCEFSGTHSSSSRRPAWRSFQGEALSFSRVSLGMMQATAFSASSAEIAGPVSSSALACLGWGLALGSALVGWVLLLISFLWGCFFSSSFFFSWLLFLLGGAFVSLSFFFLASGRSLVRDSAISGHLDMRLETSFKAVFLTSTVLSSMPFLRMLDTSLRTLSTLSGSMSANIFSRKRKVFILTLGVLSSIAALMSSKTVSMEVAKSKFSKELWACATTGAFLSLNF